MKEAGHDSGARSVVRCRGASHVSVHLQASLKSDTPGRLGGPVSVCLWQVPGDGGEPTREPPLQGALWPPLPSLPHQLPRPGLRRRRPTCAPWGPCHGPQAGSSQRACTDGPGLERGCAGPDGSPPPAGREPSPPAWMPPFHLGLRTKPSPQSVSHKQEKGLAGRAQARRHRRPTRKSVRTRLSPLSLPRTVLWGRPNTTISLPGVVAQSCKTHVL